jgi:hypothetical protein
VPAQPTTPPSVTLSANEDEFGATANTSRSMNVLANDTFDASASLTLTVASSSQFGGSVSVARDNTINYTPPASVTDVGTDRFDYTLSDGANSSTATVTVNINALCARTDIHCVGDGEEFDTNVQNPSEAFQAAVDASGPGDTVKIRGGTYTHSASSKIFLNVNVSGSQGSPITIEAFDGEHVHITGFGFAESSANPTREREVLIRVAGDYIVMRNLELSYATRYNLQVEGSFGLYEELVLRDAWLNNLMVGNEDTRVEGNLFRYIEAARARHHSGIILWRYGTSKLLANNRFENCLGYDNGYQPDGQKVPGGPDGDTYGGENSDAFESFKGCHDDATGSVDNLCPGNVVDGFVAFHNADDGIDNSFGSDSYVMNSLSFSNGPEGRRGFKSLRYAKGGVHYIGNISFSNDERGFEPRMQGSGSVHHNLAIDNPSRGVHLNASNPDPARFKAYNNLALNNGDTDFSIPSGVDAKNNWSGDSDGDPRIANSGFSASDIDTHFSAGMSVAEKVAYVKDQVKNALKPQSDSPLIDTATWIAGVHCASADDDPSNPMDVDADCRHWLGVAPDIGPYEIK